jgi:hypothetical protein
MVSFGTGIAAGSLAGAGVDSLTDDCP